MKIYQTLKNYSLPFVLLLLWTQSSKAQGNLVVNGGFDIDASEWTLTNGASFPYPEKGDPGGWVWLDSNPSPTSDPTASQSINGLVPGHVYDVSGNFEKLIDRGNRTSTGPSFGVAIDGVFLFKAADPGNFNWQSFSFLYTATASSVIVSLSAQINGTGVSYGIDNVAMYAVPEPSPSWLLLLGSGVFFYARRNKESP